LDETSLTATPFTRNRDSTMQLKCLAALLAASFAFAAATAHAAPNSRLADDKALQTLSVVQAKVQAEALSAFRAHRYAEAFGRFAELADAGHVRSAELALLMYRQGTALFGSDWDASAAQQAKWHALVINNARSRAVTFDEGRGD
jgi:hypothetical protein